MEEFSRLSRLVGEDAMKKLADARVAIFGIGGVGGYVAEALARSGVGRLDLVDHDTVAPSNINRQIIALHSTIGERKVDVMARRIADVNPAAEVRAMPIFYLPETADQVDFTKYDYVDFLIGRSGEFDVYVASVIKRARWAYGVDNSDLILVLPYEVADIEDYWQYYDCVCIPDCLEGVHPKAAMAKRNRWMVERADLVIVNVEREQGGAYRAERYAEKLGVPVVNLADDEPVGGSIRPNEK